MSSNILIKRICQYCGNEFTAKTNVTRYCSHSCNRKAYKAALKNKNRGQDSAKFQVDNEQNKFFFNQPVFLTVKEAAALLKCSSRMIYSLINTGRLNAINLSVRKTRIRRVDVDQIFSDPKTILVKEILKSVEAYGIKK
ncbi:MAG: helix-turn-helix domain-containing protein [Candidatus Chryseobacterium colombiense]|nr:helix-turn-helix domain-containing protein [Chryseobacterium sp.]WEK71447.1 MAG: helix-turn-helix domain-containing protein [Chryseobacterium sp.]